MAGSSRKVSNLSVTTTSSKTDRVLILKNPASVPNTMTITVENLMVNVAISNSAPSNSTANGFIGNVRYGANYIYICTANNTWSRIAYSNTAW